RFAAGVLDVEVELLGPAPTPPVALAEGVARFMDGLEHRLQVGVKVALLDQPSPQLVDDGCLLDPDRACFDAGVALHARPDGLSAHTVLADNASVACGCVGVGCPIAVRPGAAVKAASH